MVALRFKRSIGGALLGCVGLTWCAAAQAQTAPSPGDISRQLEPARPPALPELQLQPPRLQRPSTPAAGAQVVRVQQWRFVGNEALAPAQLQALLRPFTNVDVSLPQIREAAAVVQQAFEDAGWLARVDLPEQDITEGTVTLRISQSRLGQISFDPAATSRVARQRVQALVQAHQSVGQLIYMPGLNRGLLLADDLHGVSVVGSLQPGSQAGTTDLVLGSTAQPPYSLDLSLDNANARTVGSNKVTLVGSWVSPAGWGEVYDAQAFKSEGSDYLRLSASAPLPGALGSHGLKGSLFASQMDYRIVTPDAGGARQDISGKSETVGLEMSYPLRRSLQSNLYLSVAADERQFRGQANGQANSRYAVRAGQVSLSGNVFDSWGGGAATSYGLSGRQGQVGASQVPSADNRPVQGAYKKLNWNLSRQQVVSREVSLYAAVQGQHTGSKVLDSSENMSLGGLGGVRAYPVGEASGPQGRVVNLELRWRVHPQWLLTPFYDRGYIQKRNVDTRKAYSLQGAGVSATWTPSGGWMARATYARRLGSNPNADPNTGQDNDGSLSRGRLWMSLSRSF